MFSIILMVFAFVLLVLAAFVSPKLSPTLILNLGWLGMAAWALSLLIMLGSSSLGVAILMVFAFVLLMIATFNYRPHLSPTIAVDLGWLGMACWALALLLVGLPRMIGKG